MSRHQHIVSFDDTVIIKPLSALIICRRQLLLINMHSLFRFNYNQLNTLRHKFTWLKITVDTYMIDIIRKLYLKYTFTLSPAIRLFLTITTIICKSCQLNSNQLHLTKRLQLLRLLSNSYK